MAETYSTAANDVNWYAVAVAPRKERVAAKALQLKGFECFLPLYAVRRKWSDRVKTIELPLFPGYVFSSFDLERRVSILKIDSVISILGLGNRPEPIPEAEIRALQAVCRPGIHVVPCPYLATGTKIRIQEGPLRGVEGVLVEDKGTRLILSVSLLQRSVSVHVDRDAVAPVHVYRQFLP